MDLIKGTEVKLSHAHLRGTCEFYLTAPQVRKVQKALASNKGCLLKLSATQLKQSALHGTGFVSDAIRWGIKKGTPYAGDAAKMGVQLAGDTLADWVAPQQKGKGWLGDAGRWLGHTAVDGLATALGGDLKPRGRPARVNPRPPAKMVMDGEGWLHDAGRWLGHRAVDGVATALGGDIQPNPLANPNEGLRAALYQKKVRLGRGLVL